LDILVILIPLRLILKQNKKPITMKKVFAIVAIAGTMVACNSSSDKKTDGADTATINNMVDSAKGAMDKMVDSASGAMDKMVDSAKGAMDKMADSAMKKVEEVKPKM
jgi:ABC-type uncharacterized transport system auxiliary subunit